MLHMWWDQQEQQPGQLEVKQCTVSLQLISPHSPSSEPSEKQKETMKTDNKVALLYILDERSMYTADNLGASERNLATTAHGGGHEGEVFGGVPIFILIGDDYQLPPPTNTQKGAFDVLGGKPSLSQQKTGVAATGAQLFLDLSETCMALRTIKRQKTTRKSSSSTFSVE